MSFKSFFILSVLFTFFGSILGTTFYKFSIYTGWTAEVSDNVCGISDLHKVSNPGIIDYNRILENTSQLKEIKEKNIDINSVRGKLLMAEAHAIIVGTCEKIRKQQKLCSVWKAISHETLLPTDITDIVIGEI